MQLEDNTKSQAWVPIKLATAISITTEDGKKKQQQYFRVKFTDIQKPGSKSTEEKELQTAKVLSGYGQIDKIDIMGKKGVEVICFSNAESLCNACVKNISASQELSRNMPLLQEVLIDFFNPKNDHTKIKLQKGITEEDLTSFKYVGEIAIGLTLFEGKFSTIENCIIKQKPKRIMFPNDKSFKLLDSMAEMRDGTIIKMSSKQGAGAGSSFWNFFEVIVQDESLRKSGILKDLYESAKNIDAIVTATETIHNKKKTKIIFEYGIRFACKLSKNKVPDTQDLYDRLRKLISTASEREKIDRKKLSKQDQMVLNVIESNMKSDIIYKETRLDQKGALELFPRSITKYFCEKIIYAYNKEKEAQDSMSKAALSLKYYQLNLRETPLKDGLKSSNLEAKLRYKVTGGVYKARERIHGAVADAPLLAIPASCRRVADDNLNYEVYLN